MVWGGRTIDPQPGARFVAHRRLIHRPVEFITLRVALSETKQVEVFDA